jgi:hypothetical protein
MNPHFASIVLGMAHQATSALEGNLPPGAAEQGAGDARQVAQALIDTLGMLEDKTKGNLEADEGQLLNETLVALRFRFVQQAEAENASDEGEA